MMMNMDDVFIATEDDGSQWVMLEDYQALQQKYLLSELALEEQIKRNSALLQAAEHGVHFDGAKTHVNSDGIVYCNICGSRPGVNPPRN